MEEMSVAAAAAVSPQSWPADQQAGLEAVQGPDELQTMLE